MKTGYYHEILTHKTKKLLEKTKNKITKCPSFKNYRSSASPM